MDCYKTETPLPIQVEINSIEKFNLAFSNPPARIVHVRMQVPIDKYEQGNDNDYLVVVPY